MRDWTGIRRDTDATLEDGALLLIGASLYTTGELKRRDGMIAYTQQSGVVMGNFWSMPSGFQSLFVTSTGDLVTVAAP
jgi:hypothetical protein